MYVFPMHQRNFLSTSNNPFSLWDFKELNSEFISSNAKNEAYYIICVSIHLLFTYLSGNSGKSSSNKTRFNNSDTVFY